MAQLYATPDTGAAIAVDLSDDAAPISGRISVEFDPATNERLVALLSQSVAGWTVRDGTLARDGLAVSVNAPGHAYTDRQAVGAALATLETDTYPENAVLIPALRAVLRSLTLR